MSAEEEAATIAAIEARVRQLQAGLLDWALHMVGKYNAPVYLTGSVLHSPTPRDIDIRIVVTDHEFGARYGMEMVPTTEKEGWTNCIPWSKSAPPQRWADDIAKVGAELSVIHKHNFDVKVWPLSHWREPYPKPVLLAGPSGKWWFYNEFNPAPTANSP